MSCCDSFMTSKKVAQRTELTLKRKYAQPEGRSTGRILNRQEGHSTGGAGTLEIVLHQVLDGVTLFVLLAGNSALTSL